METAFCLVSAVAQVLLAQFILRCGRPLIFFTWFYLYGGNQQGSVDIFPTWVLSTEITFFLTDASAQGSVITVSCTIDMDHCILDDGVRNKPF